MVMKTAKINAILSGVKNGDITPIAMMFPSLGRTLRIGLAIKVYTSSAKGNRQTKTTNMAITDLISLSLNSTRCPIKESSFSELVVITCQHFS